MIRTASQAPSHGRGPTSTSKTRFLRRKPVCSAGLQRKPVPFRTAVSAGYRTSMLAAHVCLHRHRVVRNRTRRPARLAHSGLARQPAPGGSLSTIRKTGAHTPTTARSGDIGRLDQVAGPAMARYSPTSPSPALAPGPRIGAEWSSRMSHIAA